MAGALVTAMSGLAQLAHMVIYGIPLDPERSGCRQRVRRGSLAGCLRTILGVME